MKKSLIILMIIILLAAGGWFYYQNQQQAKTTDYITVKNTELVESLRASGIVKPHKTIEISSTIAENIENINYEEGAKVKKGEVLLEFDDDLAQADYEQALAQLNSAKASLKQTESSIEESKAQIGLAQTQLENAKDLNEESLLVEIEQAELEIQNALDELERRKYLYENNAIEKIKVENQQHQVNILKLQKKTLEKRLVELRKSRDNRVKEAKEQLKRAEVSYKTAQKQYLVSEENVNSAEASVNRAKTNLNKYKVRSPIDGIILDKFVEEGEYVQPGVTLLTIGTENLQIEISPDEKELNLLSVGKKGVVSPEAYPNREFEVEISSISSNVDPERGTIDVYLKPLEGTDFLIPNMSVSVEIISEKREEVKLIPQNYVQEDQNSRYVYKYE
ncbi:MAG: efflux RND transporter periplasmic adaptor subunit, partial [Halanaerobiales bacterium]|nr:efflux RND transporter periplasmic adaptor subunit [Halanaerobiales bacterium]